MGDNTKLRSKELVRLARTELAREQADVLAFVNKNRGGCDALCYCNACKLFRSKLGVVTQLVETPCLGAQACPAGTLSSWLVRRGVRRLHELLSSVGRRCASRPE
jgi:hypothetical protein